MYLITFRSYFIFSCGQYRLQELKGENCYYVTMQLLNLDLISLWIISSPVNYTHNIKLLNHLHYNRQQEFSFQKYWLKPFCQVLYMIWNFGDTITTLIFKLKLITYLKSGSSYINLMSILYNSTISRNLHFIFFLNPSGAGLPLF